MTGDKGARPTVSDDPARRDMVTVRVRGLPVAVQARAQEHSDELVRELTLVGEQQRQQGNTAGLPVRLLALVDQLTGQYSAFTAEQVRQLAEATATGIETIDLTYRIPHSAAEAAQALGDILDEADDYCRAGRYLLTLAAPDELVAYRRWFLSQFTQQAAGRPPVTWSEYKHAP
jgi:hypothetical protein